MKKILVKLLFNRYQRAILWQALSFSNHTYERRGHRTAAIATRKVMNEVASFLAPKPKPLTKEEVEEIVHGIIEEFVDKNEVTDVRHENILNELIKSARVIDPKECENCTHRDKCVLFKVIISPAMELIAEKEKSDAGDDTAETQETTNQEQEETNEQPENNIEQQENQENPE